MIHIHLRPLVIIPAAAATVTAMNE